MDGFAAAECFQVQVHVINIQSIVGGNAMRRDGVGVCLSPVLLLVTLFVVSGCGGGGGGGGNGDTVVTPADLTIRAGSGIGNVKLGYTVAQVQALLGAPIVDWVNMKSYKDMTAMFDNGICVSLTYAYNAGVSAHTPGGITINSTLDQVRAEFGPPEQVITKSGTIYYYESLGIIFQTWVSGENAGKIDFISVFRPGNPDEINW